EFGSRWRKRPPTCGAAGSPATTAGREIAAGTDCGRASLAPISRARTSDSRAGRTIAATTISSVHEVPRPNQRSPLLHLLFQRECEELEEAAGKAPVFPVLVHHAPGVGQVVREDPLEPLRGADIVDRDVQLLVQRERAIVEVGAAHRRPDAVDDQG